ncbi:AzlD domain-containing protein [Streptomyces sp. NPDC018693]|uniref:AzlD domain-containing protein n=1 Tax=unclassified Streptomyces TaxID=2593676 RepID=UPI0037A0B98F
MSATVAVILALAVGTYAFRLVGPALHGRVELPTRVQELLSAGAVLLLVALLVTGAATEGDGFGGWARLIGVLAACALAWRRVPFPVVVLVAAGVTAGLRAAGVA